MLTKISTCFLLLIAVTSVCFTQNDNEDSSGKSLKVL